MGRGEDDGEYSGEQSTATLLPGGASASPEPSSVVFSPPLVLTLFSAMAFFIYLDRGAVASNGINGSPRTPDNPTGSGIQGEFDLTLMQAGLLPAAFMIGLLVASPIYAEASKHVNGLRLMATGLFLWCLAVWGCSLSWDFVSLLLCRALVGVGEASFVALAAPYIDDHAPPDRRTLWLAIFYLQIPVGVAGGYVYGGLVGTTYGWRSAFALLASLMAPFLLFCAVAPPIPMKGLEGIDQPPTRARIRTRTRPRARASPIDRPNSCHIDDDDDEEPEELETGHRQQLLDGDLPIPLARTTTTSTSTSTNTDTNPDTDAGTNRTTTATPTTAGRGFLLLLPSLLSSYVQSFVADLVLTLSHPVYSLTVLAAVQWTSVLGVYSFWGPLAGKALFRLRKEEADLIFGLVTVCTGVVGTVGGGVIMDRMDGSIPRGLTFAAYGTVTATLFLLLGFLVAPNIGTFVPLLAVGQLALFMTQAPASAICLWAVPKRLRPFSTALTTVLVHLLGDVPSPPFLGWLQGVIQNWRWSFALMTLQLLLASGFFIWAARIARAGATDYRA